MITQLGRTFFVFICLCSAIPIKTFASIEGSYSTPSDARALRQYVVGVFSGKLAIENDGDIYLAKEMDRTERAEFAEYLMMGSSELNEAKCLVTPSKDIALIETAASSAGADVTEVMASGESALKFVDDQNQKAIITLTPKYKIRQILCASETEIEIAKSKTFFFSRLMGIVPLVKN
ncbi:hypothetical protein K6Q96_24040 [Grimontia kaedaensis]|uniref:DUF4154 domain-containing protein n=1 Tax=Grimontia kaedaensis TaxID=2872157 RepID=A0ABY4X0N6_9GAMM|nr:hypothetical protein [Grimontia kaedaensis]USH04780.1 hypothetical protein K6Q96_24040 [Grimontia kaedaensis]